jgi:hypothetical protein
MADLEKALRKRLIVWRLRLILWFARSRKWIGLAVVAVLALLAFNKREEQPHAKKPSGAARADSAIAEARSKQAQTVATQKQESAQEHERAGAEAALGMRNATRAQTESALKAYAKRVRGAGLVYLLACGLHAASAATVTAQAEPEAMVHPTSHAPGFWVPDDITRELLADAAELEHVRKALKDSRDAIDALYLVVDSQHVKGLADGEVMKSLRLELDASLERENATQAKLKAWYRRPAFLIGVGIAAGLIVPTVIVVAAQ